MHASPNAFADRDAKVDLFGPWAALRALVAAASAALRARRQHSRDLAQIALLDARGLRDLGVCPSEFGSHRAEMLGRVEHTRLRIACAAFCAGRP